MRKSIIAGILVTVAVAVAAVMILWDHGDGPKLVFPKGSGESGAAAAERPTSRGGGDSGIDWRRELAAAPLGSAADIDPDQPHTRATADDGMFRVLVVEDATGFPVPGAEVACSQESPDDGSRRPASANPLLSGFDTASQRVVADARGLAILRRADNVTVAARSGDMFGLRTFATGPRAEVRLSIRQGPFVAAKVVTVGGEPVPGVPVGFTMSRGKGKSAVRTFSAVSRRPDGVAIAHHPCVASEDFRGDGVEVTATVAGAPATSRVTVPLEKLKDGPITLVIGATGRIVVKLRDADGQPYLGEARVSLIASKSGKGGTLTEFRGTATEGTAEFAAVPIGAAVSINAEAPDFDMAASQNAATLSVPGENLTVEVRLGRRRAVVKGRALDENGSPIARTTIFVETLEVRGAVASAVSTQADTDLNGLFKLSLDRTFFRDKGSRLELEIRGGGDGFEASATAVLPKLSDSEETQIGDVRFARPEPLCSGVVVDDQGAAVEGAIVFPENLRTGNRDLQQMGGRGKSSRERLAARSDAAGKFEIRIPPRIRGAVTSFAVNADVSGYTCPEPPTGLKPGANDVRVVVRAAGTLEGRLLLPELAPVGKIQLLLSHPPKEQRISDCVDSEGRFKVGWLQPGSVTLSIVMAGSSEPMASFSDVTIPRLASTSDPRLDAIDLRDQPALKR